MIIILLILLALILTALSFDIVPLVCDIFMRRKIGTLKGSNWFESASSVAEKWCTKGLPVVPRVAGKRLKVIDIIKKEYKSTTIQSWQTASVLLAVNEINPEIAKKGADKIIDPQTGEWTVEVSRVDFAYLAYSILSNPYVDVDFAQPAMKKIADILIKKYDEYGSVPYSGNPSHRYVDAIGLVCPFLFKYALVYNESRAMEIAVELIKEYEADGFHSEFKTPVHCYDAETKAPLGLYSWGRGCGWWAVGLAESFRILQETDANSFVKEKMIVLKNLLSFSDTAVKYQSSNGAFDRNIFASSGADSSATAMLAYALAYAGELSKKEDYTKSAHKALNYIYSVTRRNGVVDYSQGDTMGIGFYSQESIVLPATQGFALRTYIILNQ